MVAKGCQSELLKKATLGSSQKSHFYLQEKFPSLTNLPPPSAPGFSCDFQEESEGPGGASELLLFLEEWQTGWWRAPRGLRPLLHGHGHLVVFIMAFLLIKGGFGIISVQLEG